MASVFLGDLDDFIAPGQACINPLFTIPAAAPAEAPGEKAGDINQGEARMQLVLEDDGGPLDAMQVRVHCAGTSMAHGMATLFRL